VIRSIENNHINIKKQAIKIAFFMQDVLFDRKTAVTASHHEQRFEERGKKEIYYSKHRSIQRIASSFPHVA
jgi:hypothetical protein